MSPSGCLFKQRTQTDAEGAVCHCGHEGFGPINQVCVCECVCVCLCVLLSCMSTTALPFSSVSGNALLSRQFKPFEVLSLLGGSVGKWISDHKDNLINFKKKKKSLLEFELLD